MMNEKIYWVILHRLEDTRIEERIPDRLSRDPRTWSTVT